MIDEVEPVETGTVCDRSRLLGEHEGWQEGSGGGRPADDSAVGVVDEVDDVAGVDEGIVDGEGSALALINI